jgi:hypothetical protein
MKWSEYSVHPRLASIHWKREREKTWPVEIRMRLGLDWTDKIYVVIRRRRIRFRRIRGGRLWYVDYERGV